MASEDQYRKFSRLSLRESRLRFLDYPRPDPKGNNGTVKLYGDHFGFQEGQCKRCKKTCDTTFKTRTQCDFHTETSRRYGGRQHPHGCCGNGFGSKGCRLAPSHVYNGNRYLDLQGYRATETKAPPADGNCGVYAVDTESVHTIKGLEVCKVSVIDTNLKVVYNEFCLPTSDIVDYNTIWSGITEEQMEGVTKTFEEMRSDLLQLISADTVLIGHGMQHDLIAMKIIHGKVVDTIMLYPYKRGLPRRRSLKGIAHSVLGLNFQIGYGGHDCKEYAEVAMKLALRIL